MLPGDLIVDGSINAAECHHGRVDLLARRSRPASSTYRCAGWRWSASTTDNEIYDHLDSGVVLNGELAIQGAILQSERVILPLLMRRTAASTIRIWFYGDLVAPSRRVKTIDFTNGGSGTSLSDKIGEVLSGSWIGW